jgi:hypothetical protein
MATLTPGTPPDDIIGIPKLQRCGHVVTFIDKLNASFDRGGFTITWAFSTLWFAEIHL